MCEPKIWIRTLSDYNRFKVAWIEPLLLNVIFNIPNRYLIIKSLFPVTSPVNDLKYYHWMWDIKPHWCENCGKPLKDYSPAFISHIKTRGAHTELRYDPINSNMLCFSCHRKWEYGTQKERERMYIYWINYYNNVL